MYPSIPHNEGLKVLEEELDKFGNGNKIPTKDLVELAEFVLKNNYFEFDSKIKQQVSGTAIGTKFAPPYACIFMTAFENKFLESEPIKTWAWFRYIDDIFFIWNDTEQNLDIFLKRLNEFNSNLKFTHARSMSSINFLDVNIRIEDETLVSNLYCKDTDAHQVLHFESCHPKHVKNFIVYCQALRIKRICSSNHDL